MRDRRPETYTEPRASFTRSLTHLYPRGAQCHANHLLPLFMIRR